MAKEGSLWDRTWIGVVLSLHKSRRKAEGQLRNVILALIERVNALEASTARLIEERDQAWAERDAALEFLTEEALLDWAEFDGSQNDDD